MKRGERGGRRGGKKEGLMWKHKTEYEIRYGDWKEIKREGRERSLRVRDSNTAFAGRTRARTVFSNLSRVFDKVVWFILQIKEFWTEQNEIFSRYS